MTKRYIEVYEAKYHDDSKTWTVSNGDGGYEEYKETLTLSDIIDRKVPNLRNRIRDILWIDNESPNDQTDSIISLLKGEK